MKRRFGRIATAILFVYVLSGGALAKNLVPGGEIIALELENSAVVIAGFEENLGAAAKEAGLQSGDILQKIDSYSISRAEDVSKALQKASGSVTVEICRNGEKRKMEITPQKTADGPRLGLYLRQGVSGIGTVTWYDPETQKFGALGHGVNDSSGKLLTMSQGRIYAARVATVKRGKIGQPGQLYGAMQSPQVLGSLQSNTNQGVFGTAQTPFQGTSLPCATAQEVKTGNAVIRSTVSGTEVQEYSVKILKVYPKSQTNGRNLLIKVTDPVLLATTGGIVQGMSGSPIIQNGKLIGAVTHVLVNDPTTGYGIFIENMMDAAA